MGLLPNAEMEDGFLAPEALKRNCNVRNRGRAFSHCVARRVVQV